MRSREVLFPKQKFAEQFEVFPDSSTLKFKWYDLVGLATMDKGLIARLEVTTIGTYDIYVGLRLTIVSKSTGEIDMKLFRFDDYLSMNPNDRSDGRSDYKTGFHAWAREGTFDWYIARPKTLEPFLLAIRSYIETWI